MSAIKLNTKQQEAVEYTEGPLLILAGAGAGKTKTISERIVHIVRNGTSPRNILAVTFTNKAAKEMRERIINRLVDEKMVDSHNPYSDVPVVKTFHGLGLMILSEQFARTGLMKHPTILDSADTLSIIKQALEVLGIDPKMYEPSKVRGTISREKGDFVSQKEYQAKVASAFMDVVAKVWRIYDEELHKQKAVDFDDLIVRAVRLLEEHTDIREYYQKRFIYVHIDEYQDTNQAQYKMVRYLVSPNKNNICVVGDTDQNIYSWRGANLKNIMNFEKDFEGTHIVLLEENYRSTGNILKLANATIAKNTVRKEKNLFTVAGEGELITVQPCWDEESESQFIAKRSGELIDDGVDPNNIAVLYRANFQSRVLEEAFLRAHVPYNVLGIKFFERKEVKDVMSYLRSAINRSSLPDLKRVLESPKKGIGKTTIAKLFANEVLPSAAQTKVGNVFTFLDKIVDTLETETLSSTLQMIIVESGMEKEMLLGGADDLERLENIRELVTITIRFDEQLGVDALPQFLEETSLQSDQDNDTEEKKGVRLMTIHASKGLEFEYVFITGLEHDLFPHKNIGNRNRSKEEEEEERRLFYVAVTRARKKLFLTHAELRTIYGQKQINAPSIFLEDVPEDIRDEQDLYYKEFGGGAVVYI
jgi:DNA helicase-2/ATP-dependent DNA helicase PcrA